MPALVDRATWDAAQAGLARNQRVSTRNAKRKYLLRGLITCTLCGRRYVGTSPRQRSGKVKVEYRCAGQLTSASLHAAERRRSKTLPGDLEDTVWSDCRRFIDDPGETLREAQAELRKRMGDTVNVDGQRQRLTRLLAEKEAERECVITLFRRGRTTIADVEHQLDAIQREASEIRS